LIEEQVKNELDKKCLRWVIEAEQEHTNMYSTWNMYDDYYADRQTPSGFTGQVNGAVSNDADPTRQQSDDRLYVTANQVRRLHENILGDFINGKRIITANARHPKNRKLAKLVQREFELISDTSQMWEKAIVPSIDCTMRRGIHWIKVWHNPYRDLPNGRIEVEELSCRDVLVDPNSRDSFYEKGEYRIHRMRYTVERANEMFGDMLDGRVLGSDNETDSAFPYNATTEQQFCTIYEIQWWRTENRYFVQPWGNGEDADIQEVSKEQYDQQGALNQDGTVPQNKDTAFKQDQDVYYVTLYNKTVGAFSHDENEYDMCTLIPMINVRDTGQTYPLSDMAYYISLQDLLNVLFSISVENSRKGNDPIVGVDASTYSKYKDAIEKALKTRGAKVIPTSGKLDIAYPQQLSGVVLEMMNVVQGFLEDAGAKHSASLGEIPGKRVAKETVNMLIAQDRQSHGRKDIMIQYTMHQVAKLICRIIFKKFKEQHWAIIRDTNKNEPQYVPVNVIASEDDYDKLLMEMLGIDVNMTENNPQSVAQITQQLDDFKKQFEQDNDVKVEIHPNYTVGGQTYSGQQMQDMVKQSGLDEQTFLQNYPVTQGEDKVYYINVIDGDPEVDLWYDIDFDYERDRQVKQSQAMYAADHGWITPKRAMEMLEFPDADEAVQEAEAANPALQMAKQLMANPQLMQQIQQLLVGGQNAA
jgi:hypothetical protein